MRNLKKLSIAILADMDYNGISDLSSHYDDEAEGSKDFYKTYLPRINKAYLEETSVTQVGVVKGVVSSRLWCPTPW